MISLVASIKKIKFINPITGFGVIQFVDHHKKTFTAKGNFGPLYAGYELTMIGQWVMNDRGAGEIFEVASFDINEPSTTEGHFLFLTSGLFAGMTKAIARYLTDRFGERTLDLIKADINIISTAPGVGIKTFIKIRNSAMSTLPQQERALQLKSEYGFTMQESLLIVNEFPESTLTLLQRKPYSMYYKLDRIPFARFDQLIQNKGWEPTDPQRIRELIYYFMHGALKDGDTVAHYAHILRDAVSYLQIDDYLIRAEIDYLVQQRRLSIASYGRKTILQTHWIYAAEKEIAARLGKIMQTPAEKQLRFNPDSPLLDKLKEHQRKAIVAPFYNKISIITGRPGAGKTTLLRTLLQLVKAQNLSFLAVSPTGKAAQRLREVTKEDCKTIHRALGATHDTDSFVFNDLNPLPYDIILIDETSMLDTPLLRSLLRAIAYTTRVVFIGDVDQLASVGIGAVYRDMILSNRIRVYWLTQVLRITKENGELPTPLIVSNGIREGKFVCPKNDDEWEYHPTQNNDESRNVIRTLLADLISKGVGAGDVQVFSPTNQHDLGVEELNGLVKSSFVPLGEPYIEAGDKVMQRENDYDLGVYNGDIGVVREVYPDLEKASAKDPVMLVDMADRCIEYTKENLYALSLAYAISGHKSQGSEYPYVIIAIPDNHFELMDRHWLYTLVTRCQKKVFLVGNETVIKRTISSRKSAMRQTMLPSHLGNYLPELTYISNEEHNYNTKVDLIFAA